MDEDGRIDTALNRILRAAGSPVLRKYMPTTQDALRKAMREIMSAEYIAGSNACEAASEFLQRKLSVTDEAVDAGAVGDPLECGVSLDKTMNLITRYKQWRLFHRAAKTWRETTGGTMRFVWRIDGARVEFSTPDLLDLPSLIAVLDTYTASLREVHTMKANA